MTYPKLSNPPIIESIFLVRFKESLDKEQVDKLCSGGVISNYSIKESEERGSVYVLKSNNSDKLIKINLDSLSLHSLSYLPFEELYSEFKAMVATMASINDELTVDLLSLRYVNAIQSIPQEGAFKLEDYLTYKIDTPFIISNFFLQLRVNHEEDSDMEGVIIQTINTRAFASNELKSGIFLDINVRKRTDFSITQDENFEETLFRMRDFKNQLFFKTVQPKIIDTYV